MIVIENKNAKIVLGESDIQKAIAEIERTARTTGKPAEPYAVIKVQEAGTNEDASFIMLRSDLSEEFNKEVTRKGVSKLSPEDKTNAALPWLVAQMKTGTAHANSRIVQRMEKMIAQAQERDGTETVHTGGGIGR